MCPPKTFALTTRSFAGGRVNPIRQYARDARDYGNFRTRRASDRRQNIVQQINKALRKTMTKVPEDILRLPLVERAVIALRAAVQKAIEEHAVQGCRFTLSVTAR